MLQTDHWPIITSHSRPVLRTGSNDYLERFDSKCLIHKLTYGGVSGNVMGKICQGFADVVVKVFWMVLEGMHNILICEYNMNCFKT